MKVKCVKYRIVEHGVPVQPDRQIEEVAGPHQYKTVDLDALASWLDNHAQFCLNPVQVVVGKYRRNRK